MPPRIMASRGFPLSESLPERSIPIGRKPRFHANAAAHFVMSGSGLPDGPEPRAPNA